MAVIPSNSVIPTMQAVVGLVGLTGDVTPEALAAQVAAESAADIARDAASDAVSQSNVPIYSSRNAIEATTIPVGLNYFRVNGWAASGDSPPANYTFVASEPSHDGKVKSLNNRWFEHVPGPEVIPGHFGAVGAGNQAAALEKVRAYATSFGMPVQIATEHFSSSVVDWRDVVLSPTTDGKLSGNIDLGKIGRTLGDLDVQIDSSGIVFPAVASSRDRRSGVQKAIWTTGATAAALQRKYKAVDFSALPVRRQANYGSDTWANSTAALGTVPPAAGVAVNTVQAIWDAQTGIIYEIGKPAYGGRPLQFHFPTTGSYWRCAIVHTTLGYWLFRVGASGALQLIVKLIGQTISATRVFGLQLGNRSGSLSAAYAPGVSRWEVEPADHRTVRVKLNGQDVTGPIDLGATNEIESICAGVIMGSSAMQVAVDYMTDVAATEATGRAPIDIMIYGDSQGAARNGDFTHALREAGDGTNGLRIGTITNRCVPGSSSLTVAAALSANGIGAARYVIIIVGVNDQQSGSPLSATENNIGGICDFIIAAGSTPVIVVEPRFFSKAEGRPTGFDTANSASPLDRIGAVLNTAANRNALICDLNEHLGPIVPGGIPSGSPGVEDNIHWWVDNKMLAGKAIADTILANEARPLTPAIAQKSLPPRFSNGWAGTIQYPTYSVTWDGVSRRIHLGGIFDAGTTTDATTVYTMPLNLRPKSVQRLFVLTGNGSCTLQIDTAGTVGVYGFTGSGYAVLDGQSFELAS